MGTYKTTTSYFCGQICRHKDDCKELLLNDECPVYQYAEYLSKQLVEPKQ